MAVDQFLCTFATGKAYILLPKHHQFAENGGRGSTMEVPGRDDGVVCKARAKGRVGHTRS